MRVWRRVRCWCVVCAHLICSVHRALAYPYLRLWSLAEIAVHDTGIIFTLGRRCILRCLLRVRAIFEVRLRRRGCWHTLRCCLVHCFSVLFGCLTRNRKTSSGTCSTPCKAVGAGLGYCTSIFAWCITAVAVFVYDDAQIRGRVLRVAAVGVG